MFRIGVDVGGTYTDLVATDESGRTVFAKSPSTPADQSIGVMAGLDELARRLNVSRADMLAATDRLVHGTTVATNALLERKGAKVALLTTEGHRDVIEMREGLKPDRYDLRSPPPEPLVPRERRFGVRERLKANGEVLIPLDAKSLDDAIAGIRQSGATSVAVCFLHSYLNPVHELAAVERLTQALPGISISRSSDVLPQIKEYERVSTTIVNAYVEPIVRRYLTNLEARLDRGRLQGQPVRRAVAWRHGAGRGSLAACRGHGAVRPRRRHVRRPALRRSGRHSRSRAVRHGRHLDRHLADLGGPGVAVRRRHAGRPAHRAAQPRHRQHRRRRRLDRERRCQPHAAGRPGKRGLGAGPGLLRQWRAGRDRHRRQCRARLSRCRRLHGRQAPARSCRLGSRRRSYRRRRWICRAWRPPPASTA